MVAAANQEGFCFLAFMDCPMLERQLKRLQHYLKAETVPGNHPLFAELETQLSAYFDGALRQFDLPLVYAGTDFQKMVWNHLRKIAYGETQAYKEVASQLHRPNAVRAIGRANGENPLAILIPCHRVIGTDGNLTGYGGGLWRKQSLLELERAAYSSGVEAGGSVSKGGSGSS
jgi:AraC family transcriptional regulator of adaptative response/methylated-DNA-[protein]-cysteine methyltransferase